MPVQTPTKAVEEAKPDLELVGSLWGGTKVMREKGEIYLPSNPAEESKFYKDRLRKSTLTNKFKIIVGELSGKLFEERVVFNDAIGFEEIEKNVDREGRDFHRFLGDMTTLTIRDGLRYVMVEAPVKDDSVVTLADDKASGNRPYLIEIDRRDVLGWKTEIKEAKQVFTQFRYMEIVKVPDDKDEFIEIDVGQIRVIDRATEETKGKATVRLFRKDTGQSGDWNQHGPVIFLDVDYVPVVPFYASRQGFLLSPPPLLDVGYQNVKLWQKESDLDNILHTANVPWAVIIGGAGTVNDDGTDTVTTIGPNSKTDLPLGSDAKYVEHSGAAIAAAQKDIQDLKDGMDLAGGLFTAPVKTGDITATEVKSGDKKESSQLSKLALNIKDSMMNVMVMVGDFMGVTWKGTISLDTLLGVSKVFIPLKELLQMRITGDLSRETFWEIFNDQFGTNIELKVEIQRLEDEGGFEAGELIEGELEGEL